MSAILSITHAPLGKYLGTNTGLNRLLMSFDATFPEQGVSELKIKVTPRADGGVTQWREKLAAFPGMRLTPYQLEVAMGIYMRPSKMCIKGWVPNALPRSVDTVFGGHPACVEYALDYNDDPGADIGFLVINPLPTGSGKAVATLAGALAFCSRREAVVSARHRVAREQTPPRPCWSTYGNPPLRERHYSHNVVILCPPSVHDQWVCTAEKLVSLDPDTPWEVMGSPSPNAAARRSNTIMVFSSVRALARLRLRFVPVLIIDEALQNGAHNPLFSLIFKRSPIVWGRCVLISADAARFGRTLQYLNREYFYRSSVVWRKMMLDFSPTCKEDELRIYTMFAGSSEVYETIPEAMGFQVNVEDVHLQYVPSLAGIMMGSAVEVSQQNAFALLEKHGVIMESEHMTLPNLKSAMCATLAKLPDQARSGSPLQGFLNALLRFEAKVCSTGSLDCPICMETHALSSLYLIQPCMHAVCNTCIMRVHSAHTCPLCRGRNMGCLPAHTAYSEAAPPSALCLSPGTSFEQAVRSVFGEPVALTKTLLWLLSLLYQCECTQQSAEYRVIVVVPTSVNIDCLAAEFKSMIPSPDDAAFFKFIMKGTKREHGGRVKINKALQQFTHEGVGASSGSSAEDGPTPARFRVMFSPIEQDNTLTGVDIKNLDCLISLSNMSEDQQWGRFTRLNRTFKDSGVRRIVLRSKFEA